jgi:hypothetical protein
MQHADGILLAVLSRTRKRRNASHQPSIMTIALDLLARIWSRHNGGGAGINLLVWVRAQPKPDEQPERFLLEVLACQSKISPRRRETYWTAIKGLTAPSCMLADL